MDQEHGHAPQADFRYTADGTIDWDDLYSQREQTWSGQPNGSLVAQVAGLAPGRVLDVGCGEGADAIWLAKNGWAVTALEYSAVALARAQAQAGDEPITWVHSGIIDAPLAAESFDLVSVHYPGLRRTETAEGERALLQLVAPGGRLLAVFHADVDAEQARAQGFDPDDYVGVEQIRAALRGGHWEVLLDARSPRTVTTGRGAHHQDDVVLMAVKAD